MRNHSDEKQPSSRRLFSGTFPSYFHVSEPFNKDHTCLRSTFAWLLEWSSKMVSAVFNKRMTNTQLLVHQKLPCLKKINIKIDRVNRVPVFDLCVRKQIIISDLLCSPNDCTVMVQNLTCSVEMHGRWLCNEALSGGQHCVGKIVMIDAVKETNVIIPSPTHTCPIPPRRHTTSLSSSHR